MGGQILMIRMVNGNLLDAPEIILIHQVNCQGAMGSGVAKAIRNKYPTVFNVYKEYCEQYKVNNETASLLGTVCLYFANDSHIVANLFGEDRYGKDGKKYTDYEALKSGFIKIRDYAKENNLDLAMPYKIGCGLGGGDWGVVFTIIQEVFQEVRLTIYKLGE